MPDLLFYAATATGPQPLPVPAGAIIFADLFANLPPGVYSALRTFEHHLFLDLDEHVARSQRAIARLGWPDALDEARLRANLDAACRAHPWADARVRYDILPPGFTVAGSRLLLALQEMHPLPDALYRQGVRVDYAPDLKRNDPIVKDATFSQQRRVYDTSGAIHEYLLLDDVGYILEGLSSNFFAVRAGVLHTAGREVLEGVTRKLLLALAGEMSIPVSLDPIHRNHVPLLTEAALSSSSRALLPIVNIAGQPVGDGKPGPLSQRLLAAYERRLPQLIRPAR